MTSSEGPTQKAYSRGILLAQATDHLATKKWRQARAYAVKRINAQTKATVKTAMADIAHVNSETHNRRIADWYAAQRAGNDSGPYPSPFAPEPSHGGRVLTSRKATPERYDEQMRAAIRQHMHARKYVGLGYEMPRRATDVPVEIPPDLWINPSFIDWDKSRISGNGLTFEAVRIVSPQWMPASEPALPPDTPRKRGPQSREAEVITAYQELDERGAFEADESYKSVWAKVRTAVVERSGDAKLLGYTTVFPFLKKLR